jgi:hypothetical protein
MAGGVGEYLSLMTGFNLLLVVIALCYIGAVLARGRGIAPQLAPAGRGTA